MQKFGHPNTFKLSDSLILLQQISTLHEEKKKTFLRPHNKIQHQFVKEHLNKTDAFWKENLSTDGYNRTFKITPNP